MITSITQLPEKTKEDIAVENLVDIFNQEAIAQKTKFRIELNYGYPHLIKHILWNFGDSLGNHQIYYSENEDQFSFIHGISLETFNEVKPILEAIDIKFKIELV